MVDIYADEGISGLEARNRDDFNRMMADCREGKIDRVLCKSISRFARNTQEYIQFVRELLRLGISIHFEKENIDTGKMTSEQVAQIYGAFAQMESTNHSSNMRFSVRMRMEKGLFVPSSVPYGYRLAGRDLEIIPEEAEVVRRIFSAYLSGQGKDDIPKRSKGVCLMNIQKTAPTPKLVTMIPADPQMTERDLRKKHLRVAPYCRVSTDKEEQLSSYEAQIEYYTEKINANPDWTMVRLYADEGITGTSAKKRKDFLQMIRDCERGKIDLVITKSVSRFCRNTLDGLNYVRRLKRHGVGVYFEKENVNTLFMDNEMILTFMMSQAQAESESLSGNVRWGHRKNFKDGKVYYHCKTFLGYRWGADGQPEIDPEQAAIVRRIFSRFLLGHSVRQITTDLMADGIKTATGKTVWHDSVVQKMLCNEKYIGDAILQKTYIADLFTREKRVNNGELPKYYVHDCHPAIIDRETFQKVQEELARRSSLKKTSSKAKTQLGKYCGKYVLSELLVCGECGSPYRRVIWTQKGVKRVVWRCQNRLEHGRKICKQSPTLDEGDIHDAVISAMNELFRMQAAKDAVKAGIAAVLAGEEQTMSLPAVELQIRNLQERQLELFQLIVSAGADCTDYDEELQQVNIAKTRLMAQKAELEKEQRGAAAFESRLAELDMALEQASGTLTDFDELTVRQLVSNIKVLDKDSLLICFKDGTEITQAMQRRQAA